MRAKRMPVLSTYGDRRIGLALGGGAARGLAHIGVLKVLEEEGIPIHCVAGTSAGSVVGAAFCAGWSWRRILDKAHSLSWTDIASIAVPRMGILRMDKLERLLQEAFGGSTFEDLGIPLSVTAVDLMTGDLVVLDSGPLAIAVRASCSIPGIFEPVMANGRMLVDGGLVDDVPADIARRMGADFILAVALNTDRRHTIPPRNVRDVFYYSLDILLASRTQRSLAGADLVVAPGLSDFSYRDLKRVDELVALGEREARAVVGKLLEARSL